MRKKYIISARTLHNQEINLPKARNSSMFKYSIVSEPSESEFRSDIALAFVLLLET
jgi:hypothetical protein